MQVNMTAESRRRLGLVLLIVGTVVIFANSFGQEALGWGFFPFGVVGAGILGLGLYWWRGLGAPKGR